jgi:hypothetical protein
LPRHGREEARDVRIADRRHQTSAPPEKLKERQEEARRGEGDRETEDDLDQPAKAAGRIAEGERQAGHGDDDDRDDFGRPAPAPIAGSS